MIRRPTREAIFRATREAQRYANRHPFHGYISGPGIELDRISRTADSCAELIAAGGRLGAIAHLTAIAGAAIALAARLDEEGRA